MAIKVLPEEFAKDEERLARFEREAKLLASLNHPNIASIHALPTLLRLNLFAGSPLEEDDGEPKCIARSVAPSPSPA